MTDDKTRTGSPERQRISLTEDHEVRDWAQRFGVTPKGLRDAVQRVGNDADDVRRELGGR